MDASAGVREGKVTFQNIYYTREFKKRFISSLSDSISQAIICSPYFDRLPEPFKDIIGFCSFLQKRGTEDIQIITRPPGYPQSMSLDVARRLSAQGVEIFIRTAPYLHAKLYHLEFSKGYFRTFVGSANFTIGGLERNHELMAEIEGVGNNSPCHREIARMQVNHGAVSYAAWIGSGQPKGEEEIQ